MKLQLSAGVPRWTVPLRPNGCHHYARVVSIANKLQRDLTVSGMNQVELEFVTFGGLILSVTSHTMAVLRELKVGDAVLFKQYRDLAKATEDGHLCGNLILVVYSKEEEEVLTANHGAFFPDVSPECLPAGYYFLRSGTGPQLQDRHRGVREVLPEPVGMFEHVAQFLELKGHKTGLGAWSEQAMESVHHNLKLEWERTKVGPDHLKYAKILFNTIVRYNSRHI